MLSRPNDLSDQQVVEALSTGWSIAVDHVEYAALGFGSHHWIVGNGRDRWFVSVDDLDARRRDDNQTRLDVRARLSAALTVAQALRDAGHEFVVAPMPTLTGAALHSVNDRYVAALYPFINGEAHSWGPYPTRDERLATLDVLVALHGVDASVAGAATTDDFALPGREQLLLMLSNTETPSVAGPYVERTQQLLHASRDWITDQIAQYDSLLQRLQLQRSSHVLTHGEPHRGNTIDTDYGVLLIDWDTALLAPRERDLWVLINEDPLIADDYFARTGVEVDARIVELYQRWWVLCEISLFAAELQQPHGETDDTRVAWKMLNSYLHSR